MHPTYRQCDQARFDSQMSQYCTTMSQRFARKTRISSWDFISYPFCRYVVSFPARLETSRIETEMVKCKQLIQKRWFVALVNVFVELSLYSEADRTGTHCLLVIWQVAVLSCVWCSVNMVSLKTQLRSVPCAGARILARLYTHRICYYPNISWIQRWSV